MSLNGFIIHQLIVSTVLLSALQCSRALRFSKSMYYPAPSMRKLTYPWKYVPLIQMPRTMQRRFMWKEMDDTVDGLMGNTANVARPLPQVFSPSMIRYRKPIELDIQSSKKIKYVIKKPPAPPPPIFKRMKVIQFRAPKHQSIPLYNQVTIAEPPAILTTAKPSVIMSFMSEADLRKIEKEQEKRVESETVGGIHQHSHQSHMDDDIVSGRINEFGADWLPMKGPFSTPKSFALSKLHTKVEGIATISAPTALPLTLSESFKNKKFSYEVTEHSAEASVQKEQTFMPSTFNFDFGTATTSEGPNYPEYFLKSFSKNEDDFKPMRVPLITTTVVTPTTTPASRRLPPRSTTEHPFKRYNLHRPKPSKLLFNRPTSSPDSTRQAQTATATENSYKVTLELQEPLKTTLESNRTTTREPSTTTTREPKKTPPEKVRTTRMNSEGKSKLRIKNVSQNEGLNKVLNKHRGSVKFGETTKTR